MFLQEVNKSPLSLRTAMPAHACRQCGRHFDFPSQLRRHEQRKTPCSKVLAAPQSAASVCHYCGRSFATRQGLYQHTKHHCRAAKLQITAPTERGPTVQELAEEIHHLKLQLAAVVPAARPNVAAQIGIAQQQVGENRGQINIGNNNQQIVINVFTEEKIDHIDGPRIKAILDDALQGPGESTQKALTALMRAAMLIYSDPDHPENMTCYLPNKKHREEALIHTVDGWAFEPVSLVCTPMIKRTLDTLVQHQPFEDAGRYGDLMRALIHNEEAYLSGKDMQTILVRNKDLIRKILEEDGRHTGLATQ